jgi:hypothetical protein
MAYSPTHVVPATGLPAWPVPDGTGVPAATLDPGLDVEVTERRADWAHIKCSNGWEAWVDGRRLVEMGATATASSSAASQPTTAPQPDTPPTEPTRTPPTEPVQTPPVSPEPAAPAAPAAGWANPAPAGAPSTAWSAPTTTVEQPQPSAWTSPGGAAAGIEGQRPAITAPVIIALVGSAIVAVSSWFNWLGEGEDNLSAYKAPANFLLESDTGDAGLNLGIVILVLGGLGVVAALVRPVRWLTIVVGAIAILIGIRFIQQTNTLVDEINDQVPQADLGLWELLDPGVYIVIGGGVVALVGGILSLARRRTRGAELSRT